MNTSLKPCLFAFDVNSFFARCYSVAVKNGEPNGKNDYFEGVPVFCLIPTLRLILKEFHIIHTQANCPYTHIALIFDHPDKNFRHELFDGYKSNRPAKPESWRIQESMLVHFFAQLGFPCLQISGVEADDVIGTLVVRLKLKDIFTIIFSGDKDLMSLCDHHVDVFAGREGILYNAESVSEKFGVPCHRLLDYLTIVGDTADHVKGIPGIGPDAAVKILNSISLDELLQDPDQLIALKVRDAKKISAWIKDNEPTILLFRQLIQLKLDVPLQTNLNKLRMSTSELQSDFIGRFIQQFRVKHTIPDPVF